MSVSCGNEDWDAFPPYGGPGKTPLYYTVEVIVEFPSGAKRSWHNEFAKVAIFYHCEWSISEDDGAGGRDGFAIGDFGQVTPMWVVGYALERYGYDCQHATAYNWVGDIAVMIPMAAAGNCLQSGTADFVDNGFDNCVQRMIADWTEPGGPAWELGWGTISWHPGQVPEWDSGTTYFIGDMVGHEGVFYVCTADNTNQEPPNATYWEVV